MHPIFLQLGAFKIHWYGVCMALAFLIGLANWIAVGRRSGRDITFCSDLLFWVMVAGILGGRLAYVMANAGYYLRDPLRILFIWEGGLIFYGGFIGAVVAVALFARRHQMAILDLFDFAFTSLPLAHAIGRIGCFLNGCCFGGLCGRWPGVRFPADSLPWQRHLEQFLISPQSSHSLAVHPVQLYETLINLLIYPLLLLVYRCRRRHGVVIATYLVAYPVGRFTLEYLRGTERLYLGAFSAAQMLSFALFAGGVLLFALLPRPPARATPATP